MPNLQIEFPSGGSRKINFEANEPLIHVLEKACFILEIDPDLCKLTYKNKDIDLSQTLKHSGIVNLAVVNLVVLNSDITKNSVKICIKLDDGTRQTWSGSCNSSLLDVLLSFKNQKINEILSGNIPTLTFQSMSYYQKSCLETLTISRLGIRNGAALLSLSMRSPPQDLDQIIKKHEERIANIKKFKGIKLTENMEESSEEQATVVYPNHPPATESSNLDTILSPFDIFGERPKKSIFEKEEPSKKQIRTTQQKSSTLGEILGINFQENATISEVPRQDFSAFKFPEETAGKNLINWQEEEIAKVQDCSPCEREAFLSFKNKTIETTQDKTHNSGTVDDDLVYETTADDLRKILADLHKSSGEDEALLTKEQKLARKMKRLATYPRSIIQFCFDSKSQIATIQACFNPYEKIESLYNFVKSALKNHEESFELFLTPPRKVLKNYGESLILAGLVPMIKVHVSIKSRENFNEYFDKNEGFLNSKEEAIGVIAKWMPKNSTPSTKTQSQNDEDKMKAKLSKFIKLK